MGPLVLPIVLASGIGLAWWKTSKRKPAVINDQSVAVFNAAILHLQDPDKLNKLADAFTTAGFTPQADILRQRAKLFAMPPEQSAQLQAIFKQALSSLKPQSVLAIAAQFDSMGALGSAKALRDYAAGLTAALTTPLPSSPVEGAAAATTPPAPSSSPPVPPLTAPSLSTLTGPEHGEIEHTPSSTIGPSKPASASTVHVQHIPPGAPIPPAGGVVPSSEATFVNPSEGVASTTSQTAESGEVVLPTSTGSATVMHQTSTTLSSASEEQQPS